MDHKDQTICNQAKALEGMRERLRSHGRKLTERQNRILVLEQENSTLQSKLQMLELEFKQAKEWIAELTSRPDLTVLRNKYSSLQGKYYKLWRLLWTFLGALSMTHNNLKGELEKDPDRPIF